MAKAKRKKKQQSESQYRFSQTLVMVMFFLIAAFFVQSFQTIREQEPVRVAVERVKQAEAFPTKRAPRSDE